MKMKNFLTFFVLILLNSFLMAATTSKNGQMTQSTTKTYQSFVLNFEQGSSKLSDQELQKLKTAIRNTKQTGEISKAEVAVWSDKEHPMTGDLSKEDQKLAKDRIDSIKEALRNETSIFERISSYNMADNSHWLGKRFHTDEAELEAVFAKKEKGALARKDFEMIQKEGGPSKAVIILNVKEK